MWARENGWHAFYTERGQVRPQGRIKPVEGGYETSVYNGHSGYIQLETYKHLWTAKKCVARALMEGF